MNFLDDVINLIISLGFATQKDVDIFKDYSPKEPHECMCVYEYEGSAPSRWAPVSVRSVQIVCRSKKRNTAKERSWKLYQELLKFHESIIQVGGTDCLLHLKNTPTLIDIDSMGRALVAFNLAITIKL